MKTTIYLIRHSIPSKNSDNIDITIPLQIRNEKNPLSPEGEQKAKELSKMSELKNIDVVISSNYVRALSTAKYIAKENNINIVVNEAFGERKHGINNWNELPENFEQRQLEDKLYKLPNGESQEEVANRMYNALLKVLKENKGKRVAIVSHATAITFLFIKLGKYIDKNIYFNDKIVIDKEFNWNAPEIFKLEFNDNKLINIKNIR